MNDLRERVFESINNAVANGYDMRAWAPSEVATDLLDHDADLEYLEPDDVLPHIIEWQLGRNERIMRRVKLDDVGLLKFGNTIQMIGAVYEGEGQILLAMFPEDRGEVEGGKDVTALDMDSGDWERFLRQTDLLETEVLTKASDGKLAKAILRKSQRQISQGVSWAVYKRDGYRCRYCAADDVPLTVDHLVLWEEGGPSIESNLLASCRKCNKTRGNTQYAAWLKHPYYQAVARKLDAATQKANQALVETLGSIPRQVHQPTHR